MFCIKADMLELLTPPHRGTTHGSRKKFNEEEDDGEKKNRSESRAHTHAHNKRQKQMTFNDQYNIKSNSSAYVYRNSSCALFFLFLFRFSQWVSLIIITEFLVLFSRHSLHRFWFCRRRCGVLCCCVTKHKKFCVLGISVYHTQLLVVTRYLSRFLYTLYYCTICYYYYFHYTPSPPLLHSDKVEKN